MTTDPQLDHSLTSMEWLYRMSINKQLLAGNSNKPNENEPPMFMLSPFSIMPELKVNNNNNNNNVKSPDEKTFKSNHSIAQRAEPHRPVDLSAEYKGTDQVKREGKPPYSYVNLITFAINSNPKKRMTLNEIYQWISDNFHYYRNAGNGWKVTETYFFILVVDLINFDFRIRFDTICR